MKTLIMLRASTTDAKMFPTQVITKLLKTCTLRCQSSTQDRLCICRRLVVMVVAQSLRFQIGRICISNPIHKTDLNTNVIHSQFRGLASTSLVHGAGIPLYQTRGLELTGPHRRVISIHYLVQISLRMSISSTNWITSKATHNTTRWCA